MDALVQHVLEEIAMDGELGTDVRRLRSFVDSYYARSSPQNADDRFFSFVWDTLVQEDDITLAVLEPAAAAADAPASPGPASPGDLPVVEEGPEPTDDDPANKKGKGKARPKLTKSKGKTTKKKAARTATHTLVPLAEADVQRGLEALDEQYGDKLRVTVSPEASWVAITGSHNRPTSVSPMVYSLLQLVSRSRGDGITVVECGKTLDIDQRSAFHYVRACVTIGAIKKYRDHEQKGTWTNRLVHVRFLDICKTWHAHLATDDRALDGSDDGKVKNEDDGDGDLNDDERTNAPASLPHSSLWSNMDLVRRRVIRAIRTTRERGQDYLLHQDIAPSIGLVGCQRRELRKLNTIITSMADEGLVQKILVPYEGLNGLSRVHCIKLPDEPDLLAASEGPVVTTSRIEAEDESDDLSRALVHLSIERQIFDILADADLEGLCNRDITRALGHYTPRTIESLFTRYIRDKPPAHLADFTVHALFETVGRQKRLRYFLLPGYRRRCVRDGIVDPTLAEAERVLTEGSVPLGGFAKLERGFYLSADDLEKTLAVTATKSSYGKGFAPQPALAGAGAPAPKRRGMKPKPRKPGAPLTYYERMKQDAARRIAEGLPPRVKRPLSGGGRRPKGWVKPDTPPPLEVEEGADVEVATPNDAEPADGDKGKPKPRKKKATPAKPAGSRSRPRAKAMDEGPATATNEMDDGPLVLGSAPPNATDGLIATILPPTPPTAESPPPIASTSHLPASIPLPALPPAPDPSPIDRPNKRRNGPHVDVPASPVKRRALARPVQPASPAPAPAPAPISRELSPTVDPSSDPTPSMVSAELQTLPVVGNTTTDDDAVEKARKRKKGSANQRRGLVPYKPNLTALQRQTDVVNFLTETGGICEGGVHFVRDINSWHKEKHGGTRFFSEDKSTREQTLAGLVDEGKIRKTVVQVRGRRDLYHLPDVEIDSDQWSTFLANLAEPVVDYGGWKNPEKQLVERPPPPKRGVDPSPDDSRETIADFFVHEYRVLGAKYGCLYGRFARAKELHRFLVRVVHSYDATSSKFVFSRGSPNPNILVDEVLTTGMPLHVYLRILPVPEYSPAFDEFIADPLNMATLLGDLPPWVFKILSPGSVHRKRALNIVLRSLTELHLIKPLIEQPGLPGASTKVFTEPARTQRQISATHWRLLDEAPVYACADNLAGDLIAVSPLSTPADVDAYWDLLAESSLRPASTPKRRTSQAPRTAITSPFFPHKFPCSKAFAVNLTSTTKWQESYMLIEPQRTFLTKIAEDAQFDVDLASPDFLAQTAADILAPLDVVVAYLRQVQSFRANAGYTPLAKRRKLSRNRRPATRDDRRETAEDLRLEAETRQLAARAAVSFSSKAGQATAQREAVWASLVERFRGQHPGFVIEPRVLEFLQKRFCTTIRARQLTGRDVERELTLLLPVSRDGEADVEYRSIIPSAVHQAAALSADPYALPRAPVIRKKPARHRRTKAKAVAAAELVPSSFVFSGAPHEFFSRPQKPLPTLAKGQRLPRNFFDSEDSELVLDAVAVLRARSDHLDQRIAYASLEQLWAGCPTNTVRQLYMRLVSKGEDRAYHERLKDAWNVVWAQKRGTDELPDPEPTSMTDFDIAAFVRCLRANVDKQALRMAGPKPAEDAIPSEGKDLPPLAELEAAPFVVETQRADLWSVYWRYGTTTLIKEVDIAVIPFSSACWSHAPAAEHEVAITMAALKMQLITPDSKYSPDAGKAFLRPHLETLEEASNRLSASYAIVKCGSVEPGRRLPGRNFVLGDKYLASFEGTVDSRKASDARRADEALHVGGSEADGDPEEIWPLIVEDGDMMALVRLVSDGALDVTVDTSTTLDLRPIDDYQTRQASDESIECAVQVGRAAAEPANSMRPLPPPAAAAPSLLATNDQESPLFASKLASIIEALEDPSASRTMHAIRAAGVGGVAFSVLTTLLPELRSTTLATHVRAFVSSETPLAFWAGHDRAVLVASDFLDSWTVLLAPPHQTERVFPAVWLGITGDVVPVMFEKALRWVQEALLSHAGLSAERLADRARANDLLSLVEIMQILNILKEGGVAYAIDSLSVAMGRSGPEDGETDVNWESARWYPAGRWFR